MPPPPPGSDSVGVADLRAGQVVHGLTSRLVTVVATAVHGPDSATVTYRTEDGALGERLVYATDAVTLRLASAGSRWPFDGNGADFRLAAEALRIRMAGVHESMLAVTSSDLRPLPHQIRAVYGEMLPRTPLRFLLADDPGAGKTIMAGLLAKELLLRGDLTRLLIVAPGGLVEQWQDELARRFGMQAQILTRDLIGSTVDGNPFDRYPLLIARMDQLARDDRLKEHLAASQWDLVVVDEAHRMSAHWYGGELDPTRRYQLGQLLGRTTRHLLLMTATPHAGDEADFQAFLALLDPDRFEGPYRPGVHSADTSGLMRRMVKEDLLTFEGKHLFPERIAETLPYGLSPLEKELYEGVTRYVREEMSRADQLAQDGDAGRRRTVGFALTVLQRRLASSPEAIYHSLRRRIERLEARRTLMLDPSSSVAEDRFSAAVLEHRAELLNDVDELDADEAESIEDDVVDAATAARTAAELAVEIAILSELLTLAGRVRASGEDRKWSELRGLLTDRAVLRHADGTPRKLIVFTEHRDTLTYLERQIRNVLGSDDAVVTIHGGTRREDRRLVREQFTQEPHRQVLLATDAAGEGLNLQAAHLMVNYDLPWNPNRIEQRFGRIHRIGQEHVCRLWNLLSEDTREGQVFSRLLSKADEQRRAYGGRLFDVLGKAFTDKPLRDVLIEAIRYGDDPARQAELNEVVDAQVADGVHELVEERALARELLPEADVSALRQQMDEARARRLQPHFVERFFVEALSRTGGRISAREQHRFEITHVPAALRERQGAGTLVPLAARYERVTFEPEAVGLPSGPSGRTAELLAPGHPLLDAVLDDTLRRFGNALRSGTVLVDEQDPGTTPHLLVAVAAEVADGTGRTVSRRFAFVRVAPDGAAGPAGPAPHLALTPVPDDAATREVVATVLSEPWLTDDVEQLATSWAAVHEQADHLERTRERLVPWVDRTTTAVQQRLLQQVNWLHSEAVRAQGNLDAGKKVRRRPDGLRSEADRLEARLAARLEALDAERLLTARPPRVLGTAVVVPAGLLAAGGATDRRPADTTLTERRAVDAVLAAEKALHREATEQAHNNKGFDISSIGPDGHVIHIEVKGRVEGAETFVITTPEVLHGKNAAPLYRLALVEVSDRGPEHDEVRYLEDPFHDFVAGSFQITRHEVDWRKEWAKGGPPR